jgi:hypothetical protein
MGLSGGLAAQGPVNLPSKPGTGLIVGRVVDAQSGKPLADAGVAPVSQDREAHRSRLPPVLTDAEGQFVLARLPAGRYRIEVTKPGFVDGGFGQRVPNRETETITLADGQAIDRVTIRLWKFGVVTGTVVDEAGEPIIGVEVATFSRTFQGGRPFLSQSIFLGSRRTDDRGVYRITGLVPGEYVVAIPRVQSSVPLSTLRELERLRDARARDQLMSLSMTLGTLRAPQSLPGSAESVRAGSVVQRLEGALIAAADGGPALVYASQFYAGASRPADARTIIVRSGEDVAGIDFALKPSRTVRVSGTATGPDGPVPHLPLRLVPAGTDQLDANDAASATTLTDAGGVFTFGRVIAGEYVLRALRGGADEEEMGFVSAMGIGEGAVTFVPEQPIRMATSGGMGSMLSGALPVSVGARDVDGLALIVRQATTVSGRIEFTGAASPPDGEALKAIRVVAGPADGRPGSGARARGEGLNQAGEFTIDRVPPGRYVLGVTHLPDGWVVETVSVHGRDVTDRAIEAGDRDITDVAIRITNRTTMVAGTVRRTSAGASAEDVSVIVFPIEREAWIDYGPAPRRLQQSWPSSPGAFAINGLPPGEYFIVAVRDDGMRDWRDPAFLAAAARTAARVRLAPGDRRTVDLTVATVR